MNIQKRFLNEPIFNKPDLNTCMKVIKIQSNDNELELRIQMLTPELYIKGKNIKNALGDRQP